MATLHVRNVPDELYERLRASAEEDGRSIGAQATALLRSALSDRDFRREAYSKVRIGGQSPFRKRFAKSAKTLVVLAMLEDDVLRPTLERGGVTDESVRAALPPPAKKLDSPPPLSADARQMLERALLASLDASLD